jgi:hypothetical protein
VRDAHLTMERPAFHPTSWSLESVDVIVWRRRRLEVAGFAHELAHALAADRRTDVHALLDLVDRGCRPDLAARILAPLDPPEAAA